MNQDHAMGGIIGAVISAILAVGIALASSKGIDIKCPAQPAASAAQAPASSK